MKEITEDLITIMMMCIIIGEITTMTITHMIAIGIMCLVVGIITAEITDPLSVRSRVSDITKTAKNMLHLEAIIQVSQNGEVTGDGKMREGNMSTLCPYIPATLISRKTKRDGGGGFKTSSPPTPSHKSCK